MFHVSILTMFPEMFPGPLQYSLAGQALQKNIWSYEVINIRDFGLSKHKNVDDVAYGGGNGMIMRADVAGAALGAVIQKNARAKIYYPSPRGKLLTQSIVREIVSQKNIILLCGRFEGVDERVITEYNATEISIGDYILSGGEIAAFTLLDSVVRLLPGAVRNQDTLLEESLELEGEYQGMLEPPLYTRPEEWRGHKVPAILLSGDHEKIKQWKLQQSRLVTKSRRPDLIK